VTDVLVDQEPAQDPAQAEEGRLRLAGKRLTALYNQARGDERMSSAQRDIYMLRQTRALLGKDANAEQGIALINKTIKSYPMPSMLRIAPGAAAAMDTADLVRLQMLGPKFDEGTATDEEEEFMLDLYLKRSTDKTFAREVDEGLMDMVPFMAEVVTSHLGVGVAAHVARKTAGKLLGREIRTRAGKFMRKHLTARLAEKVAKAGVEVTIGDYIVQETLPQLLGAEGGRVTLSQIQRSMKWGKFTLTGEDYHNMRLVAEGFSADFEEVAINKLGKGRLDMLIEGLSERTGPAISPVLSRTLGMRGLFGLVLRKTMGKSDLALPEALQQVSRAAWWDGPGGELLEEVEGDLLRGLSPELEETVEGAVPPPFGTRAWRDFGVMAVMFSVPAVAGAAFRTPVEAQTPGDLIDEVTRLLEEAIAEKEEAAPEASPEAGRPGGQEQEPQDVAPSAAAGEEEDSLEAFARSMELEQPLEEVEPEGSFRTATRERLAAGGINLRIVRGEGPLDMEGVSLKPGEILVDESLSDERFAQVAAHEVVHHLAKSSNATFQELYAEFKRIDPAGLQEGENIYRQKVGEKRWAKLSAAVQREEGAAVQSETLASYLEYLSTAEGRESFDRILDTQPGLIRRIVDAIRRVLRSAGYDVETWQEGLLRKLGDDLGGIDAELAPADVKKKAEMARLYSLAVREVAKIREQAPAQAAKAAPKAEAPDYGSQAFADEAPGPEASPVRKKKAAKKKPKAKGPRKKRGPRTVREFIAAQGGLKRSSDVDATGADTARAGMHGYWIRSRGGMSLNEARERLVDEFPNAQEMTEQEVFDLIESNIVLPSEQATEDLEGKERAEVERQQRAQERERPAEVDDFLDETGEPRFSPAGKAPPFYSALERGIEGMKQKRFTAQQLGRIATRTFMTKARKDKKTGKVRPSVEVTQEEATGVLKDIPGVTADELKWVGWDEMLRGRKSITKDETLEWLRAHRIEVRDTVLETKGEQRRVAETPNDALEWLNARGIDAEGDYGYIDLMDYVDLANHMASMEAAGANPPRHGDSTLVLPGGENYREVLLALPVGQKPADQAVASRAIEAAQADGERWELLSPNGRQRYQDRARRELTTAGGTFTGGHYGDIPNVLAHLRFNERTDADGGRVLFIEEIQSDWHQEGRKKGYDKPFDPADVTDKRVVGDPNGRGEYVQFTWNGEQFAQKLEGMKPDDAVEYRVDRWRNSNQYGGVPDAPFKATWPALAFKRALKWAADNGFDSVGWTTGAQQVERYETSLRSAVDEIVWEPMPGGFKGTHISANKGGESRMNVTIDERGIVDAADQPGADGKPLEDLVGKEIAKRILAEPRGTIEEEGLTIGGKGMQDFYDKILVNVANKLGKRFGVKAGRAALPLGEEGIAPRVSSNGRQYWVMARLANGDERRFGPRFDTAAEAMDYERQLSRGFPRFILEQEAVHTLPLTDDMRATAKAQGYSTFAARYSPKGKARTGRLPKKGKKAAFRARTFEHFDAGVEGNDEFMDLVRRKLQDKDLPLKRFVDAVVKAKGKVVDETHVYRLAELLPGRTAFRLKEIEREYTKPMLVALRAYRAEAGISGKEALTNAGQYVYALHAKEANQRLMDVFFEEDFDHEGNAGSGMPTSEAEAIQARLGKVKQLREVARLMKAMNIATRKAMLDGGLISQATYDTWEEQFDNYVPLRTEETDEGGFARAVGYQVRGKEVKRRLGRRSPADNPLVFSMFQAKNAVIRAEKNKVGQAFGQLLADNDTVVSYTREELKEEDPENRKAIMEGAEESFFFKEAGKDIQIRLTNKHLARALKNVGDMHLGEGFFGQLLKYSSASTRFLSRMATSYNPGFILSNIARDLGMANVVMGENEVKRLRRDVIKTWPGAFKAYLQYNRTDGKVTGKHAKHMKMYFESGARTDWFYSLPFQDQVKDIERELSAGNGKRAVKYAIDIVEDMNGAAENAVRYSLFHNLLEAGKSVDEAASAAKNLTVNFNRRGEWGAFINAGYMFYNASVQGNAKAIGSFLGHKSVRQIVGGVMVAGVLNDLLQRLVSDDDDDGVNYYDKIPSWQKERNLIIMNPLRPSEHFKIPLPWVFNVPYFAGQQGAAAAAGVVGVGEAAGNVLLAALNAVNPMGGGGSVGQFIAPTLLDPLVQIGENKKWYGGPIIPQDNPFDIEPPMSEKYFRGSVSRPARVFTTWLNAITGGDAIAPGAISLSPEHLEHVVEFGLSGFGRWAQRNYDTTDALIWGEEVQYKNVPFFNRFYGEHTSQTDQSTFYDYKKEIERLDRRVDLHQENGAYERAQSLVRESPGMYSLRDQVKAVSKEVSRLRRESREQGIPYARKRMLEKRMDAEIDRFNKAVLAAQRRTRLQAARQRAGSR